MRIEFKKLLFDLMDDDDKIHLFTADLGFGFLDNIRKTYPSRFCNVMSDEFLMLHLGCGMALSGKIPICFSITPFLLWRPSEVIRLYINHENIPVKMLSTGRDLDYKNQGFSHDGSDAKQFMSQFPNIKCFWPETIEDLKRDTEEWLYNDKPSYLNLKR